LAPNNVVDVLEVDDESRLPVVVVVSQSFDVIVGELDETPPCELGVSLVPLLPLHETNKKHANINAEPTAKVLTIR
jgi:hypothetical protein